MPEPVEGTAFRTAMRRVPSPVVVATAQGDEDARGITIGSFTSVALDPPLVSFNVGRESRMYEVMEECTQYVVHVLSEHQAHLATRFAEPGLTGHEQFQPVPTTHDKHGTPLLEGVTARFRCMPHSSIPAGDHTLYVGLVVDIETPPDQGAVLYYKSNYRGVGKELPSTELSPVNRVSSDSS
ncbi:MAG: flavin reductase [Bacteroidetes bacterium SW_9_63_38]|nr:MAG: flavin reductase [Bacteroidetes bacterium SW_9_63_38]